ncbi:MAG: hypothetical protein Ta2A_04140 [Treponemataceae bacterium]|nr:MAG: hypothetical protein Ta2A_04140 [Treponemataceae bacterium]
MLDCIFRRFSRGNPLLRFFSILCFVSLFGIFPAGCQDALKNIKSQKSSGKDAVYFAALEKLGTGDERTAIKYFRRSAKDGSLEVRRNSCIMLTEIGTAQEKADGIEFYVANFKTADSYLRASEHYFRMREFSRIVSLTDNMEDAFGGEKIPAKLFRLRMEGLLQKKDRRFFSEFTTWFTQTEFCAEHNEFLTRNPTALAQATEGKTYSVTYIVAFRNACFRRDYGEALRQLNALLSKQDDEAAFFANFHQTVFSDAGRTMLYGGSAYEKNAQRFDAISAHLRKTGNTGQNTAENLFFSYFYAGRIYDKSGTKNSELALDRFQKAIASTTNGERKDSALWYYLSALLKSSPDAAIAAVEKYASQIHDESYFSDFFDSLATTLLQNSQWNDFVRAARACTKGAGPSTNSKYAYIAGRLIEDGLVKAQKSKRIEADEFFKKATEPGSILYYRLMAARRLELPASELEKTILSPRFAATGAATAADAPASEIEKFLNGYAAFGFPDKIYDGWWQNRTKIDYNTSFYLSGFLEKCIPHNLKLEGLKIASRLVFNAVKRPESEAAEEPALFSKENFSLAFPAFFQDEITKVSEEFNIPPYLVLAVVRSESFFDPGVSSHAKAKGLMQLMDATAAGIAKSLRVTDYDVFNAAQNLRFGSYYLSMLVSQQKGNVISAVFAYNAGMGRVRKWEKAQTIPLKRDLFLETVPFAETRDYGRAVTAAAAIYGWLYYDIPVYDTLDYIM